MVIKMELGHLNVERREGRRPNSWCKIRTTINEDINF